MMLTWLLTCGTINYFFGDDVSSDRSMVLTCGSIVVLWWMVAGGSIRGRRGFLHVGPYAVDGVHNRHSL